MQSRSPGQISYCIHQLIEEQAQSTPDALAVVFEEMHLTYQALDRCAHRLAARLKQKGNGPDRLVGLYIERGLEMIIALLAILKSGGAYVPLDPGYPRDRLDFMLRDAPIKLLLTQHSLLKDFPLRDLDVVFITPSILVGAQSDESTQKGKQEVHPENLAYVIYTSGSTGTPKGVQIPHCTVVNLLLSMYHQLNITNQDIFFSVTTFSFDIAYLEIFLPLMIGAKLVVANRVAASGFRLEPALAAASATVMQATPATWNMLLKTKWHNTTLRMILCGGEALTPVLTRALREQGASLWNLYGPTETTIWSIAGQIEDTTIVLGLPIENTSVYILDACLQPVPIGTLGELYIGGKGLARGYRHRPDLTAERFIPHPFSSEPGARLYRTGDLARYTIDGALEYCGRIDNQIKLRGFRIELGEIEAVLNQHESVHQCVVMMHEQPPGEKWLAAYIVYKDSRPLVSELRSYLLQSLPNYMLPAVFMFLDTLPLTPNGKIDRRALPIPEISS